MVTQEYSKPWITDGAVSRAIAAYGSLGFETEFVGKDRLEMSGEMEIDGQQVDMYVLIDKPEVAQQCPYSDISVSMTEDLEVEDPELDLIREKLNAWQVRKEQELSDRLGADIDMEVDLGLSYDLNVEGRTLHFGGDNPYENMRRAREGVGALISKGYLIQEGGTKQGILELLEGFRSTA
ncbi:hypothetical protein HOD38_02465 [archaeon]|nr:hypothetical protein [archaeon]MBT4397106.1 hypothetical protein [archaeon]MBT4441167.1 hypothetical protein [archaeon]